jgi:type II secretory ATPase GspE/PulE/Tfp pilus assembly ATPase PilB-like protein
MTNPIQMKNYTYASGLRRSLRQDPDVIMVGEIRDKDTADTAIHAALTGHLVFSTLHTNNAAGAFTRLIDLEINPKILTSAINIAIAQRLVRKLCPDCKKKIKLEGEKLILLKEIYSGIKIQDKPEFTDEVFAPVGCAKCNNIGYKGRIGIFEAVLSNSSVEKIIQENPSEHEIQKTASDQGIMSMAQDGVVKVIKGITSLEEVERVVDLEEQN